MEVIKQTSAVHPSMEEAQDALFALTHLPGYVFGYVDEAQLRTVSFHRLAHPIERTFVGQQKVTLVFAAAELQDLNVASLKPVADAIFGQSVAKA